ncbi:DUF1461 domain-containing protein [uncultured Adlercreutzia sp.]|uniref:lipoprotein intramolecular transacylase Lit n=1 Tax=uncultured Adlercreutzia sp. TaxID=875803 RepID=UPI0026F3DBCE|nr:DUF1461 domain-containing protein [uncultured Adlercreutzia sp.]
MNSQTILAGLGAALLAATLLVAGFAVCCLPATTKTLAQAMSTGDDSPYTHDELVPLAVATRAFTVDAVPDRAAAADGLAGLVVQTAREASAEGAPKAPLWTTPAKEAIADEAASPTEAMEALAQVGDRYALDADAMSHLEDCNRLITGVSSWLGMIAVAALLVAAVLLFQKHYAALAFMLRMGPAFLVAVLAVLAVWGVVDFNGLFAVFHSLFFVDGTWTFNYDSLLISMYPIDFWMGMGAVWVASAVGCGLICFALGCVAAWRAQIQQRRA